MEPALQGQVNEASQKESKPSYLPPALGTARSPPVGADVEKCYGNYNQRDVAGKIQDGQNPVTSARSIAMRPDTSSDENGIAEDEKRRKKKTKKKRNNSKRSRKSREGDTSSDGSKTSDSETSDA